MGSANGLITFWPGKKNIVFSFHISEGKIQMDEEIFEVPGLQLKKGTALHSQPLFSR